MSMRSEDELRDNVETFNWEQRTALMDRGYFIYLLRGRTLNELRQSGLTVTTYPGQAFENGYSIIGTVAFKPDRLFLPGSSQKTLSEQQAMVAEFGRQIGSEIPGTTAIIGSVTDYAEMAHTRLGQAGQRLFGKEFDFGFTRASAQGTGARFIIGGFREGAGLLIYDYPADASAGNVRIVPLVVTYGYRAFR